MAALTYPVIDPRNEAELVEQSIAAVYQYSNGALNDFSSGSALRVLIEGLCFAGAEILYYANSLVEALVVAYLSNYGITRSLGTPASAPLTFTLIAPFNSNISIPAGTQVQTAGGILFATQSALVFPAGAISGTVNAIATSIGSAGNVASNQITQLIQPLSYVQAVTNLAAATGGSDEETQQQAIDRGIAQIRRRNLVSGPDYEEYAAELLGIGSVARAIGNRSGDGASFQVGSVCVFVLDAAGNQPNNSTLATLTQSMASRIMLGTTVFVRPIELFTTAIELVARLSPGEESQAAGDALWDATREFFRPSDLEMGSPILRNELLVALRNTGVISHVQSLTLNGVGADLIMPNDRTISDARTLTMRLIDDSDNVFWVFRSVDAADFVYEGDIV